MAENNAVCSICGRPYHLCLSCRDSINMNPWKVHTDTAEHYKVYQILHGLSTGVYTKDEAKIRLDNVDLSDLENFRQHIKERIKNILKEENSVKKTEIDKSIDKPIISRKRNYKTKAE